MFFWCYHIVFTQFFLVIFCPSSTVIGNKQENPVFFTGFPVMKTGFPCENVNTGNPVLIIGNGFAVYLQILQEHLETESPWNISTATIWSFISSNSALKPSWRVTFNWKSLLLIKGVYRSFMRPVRLLKCNRKLLLGQNSVRFLCQ